jgi:hypothetical protein
MGVHSINAIHCTFWLLPYVSGTHAEKSFDILLITASGKRLFLMCAFVQSACA